MKGIKTLYCNCNSWSVGFCSPFFCIPISIEIEKLIGCCAFSINWTILEQIFYFNSIIGFFAIVHLFTIQFYIKIFQKWVRSIYNTTVVICGNIAAISCLIHFKIDWHSSIMPIEWSDLSTVISNNSNLYPSFFWRALFRNVQLYSMLFPSQKQHLRIFQYT